MAGKNIIRLQAFWRSELLKNTSILISGTTLAQLIPILLQPVLRRYYTPEYFGAYSVYLSLIGIFIVISSFKYELAIILPKKDKEASNIFFLAQFFNLLFNIALLIAIVIWNSTFLSFLNLQQEFAIYLYLVPLGTFLFNFYQSINYWLIRKKAFFPVSVNKFVRRGTEGSSQVISKLSGVPNGLIWGDVLGHVAHISSGIIQVLKKGLSPYFFSWRKIRYVLSKYSEYPKYNVLPGFLSACSYLLPAILINKFYSSEYAGFFDLSKLLLSIPLALVATSISNVLLQRVSEKYRNNLPFAKDLIPVLIIVAFIGIMEILVITLWGIDLFNLFFGETWELSGRISKILVWSYAFNFLIASFSSIFIAMKRIKLLSIWQLFYFMAILSLFLFKNHSFMNFIKVYVIIEVVCYFVITLFMLFIVKRYESQVA